MIKITPLIKYPNGSGAYRRMTSTQKLPTIFLLVSSLEAEELVFTNSPEEGKDWALCSQKIVEQLLKGTLTERIYILSSNGVTEFPVLAVSRSEFECI